MEVESEPEVDVKRRRAKHSKTRKGCLRCKQRHIKCDEEAPACSRCVQSGLPCPGYNHDTTRPKRGPVKRFRIVHSVRPVLAPAVKACASATDVPKRANSIPTPTKEQSAIDFFLARTISMLANYVPGTQLWTTATFKLLLVDAKIRNIAIAIGLAHQDIVANLDRGDGPYTSAVQAERSGITTPPEAMDADRYYNSALAFMRMDITTVRQDASAERTDVAAACLLIVIYLSMHNRMEEAGVHLSCGLEVVSEGGQAFITASLVNQEIYRLFLHFAVTAWPTHPSGPMFQVIQATINLSPFLCSLDSLMTLRTDIDLCAQRIFVYTHHVTNGNFPDTTSSTVARNDLLKELELLLLRVDTYSAATAEVSDQTIKMMEMFANSMRARLTIFTIFTRSVATRYQTTYDRHSKAFGEAVDSIWRATQLGIALMGTDWPLMSIHLNILGTLRLINALCRHPAIRRRSLDMLKYIPQREGVVEAGEGHQLGRIAIEFEEAGLEDQDDTMCITPVPEENRLHFIESIRRAQLQGIQMADDEIMVRLMYKPDGESSYIERRVRKKREHFDLRDQKLLGSRQMLQLTA